MKRKEEGFTLIELLIVVAIIGIIAAIAIPNLLNAIDRGKQKRTMADLRSIGTSIEAYAVDNNNYPTATDVGTLGLAITPVYIKTMPDNDGWNHLFQVASATNAYTIYSQGKDGTGTTCTAGVTTNFQDEICFVNGQFLRYPQGTQQ
ncbi:MAG TPA: type II secretion system protein GspG [Candidatus Polarisedimenticolia bacterium]|nr:type II secretion system protein GspG [Candidatus Polarisedimenticolia bacterium]